MRSGKRGIALLTVLIVTFLMTMMTGALVGNHQANFAILADSIHQREAAMAASSALDYAKYKLELDRTWGATDFPTITDTFGELEVKQEHVPGGISGINRVKGTFLGSIPPQVFTLDVENFLTGGAPAGLVPAKAVRLRITGVCGPFQTRTETTLVEAPLYDAAASSNGSMTMDAVNNWTINSEDPLRNWVRSNEEITLPDVLDNALKHMTFTNISTRNSPGVAWSKKDIYLGNQTNNKVIDGSNVMTVLNKANGLMAPRSNLNYNIYDLKLKDLKKPSAAEIQVPAGTYTVTTVDIPYQVVHWRWGWDQNGNHNWGWHVDPSKTENKIKTTTQLLYTDSNGNQKNLLQGADVPASEPPPSQNPHNWNGHDWRDQTQQTNVVLPPGAKLEPTSVANISQDFTSDYLKFDFNSKVFTAKNSNPLYVEEAGTTVKTGNFVLNSTAGQTPPSMVFEGATPGYLQGASDIYVQGTVTGKASMAAGHDLHLAVDSNLQVDANTQNFLLWSGHDIQFAASAGQNMLYRGLVYSKHDVTLDFGSTPNSRLDNLVIDGALVAQSGKIGIYAANTVNMTYNPKYLDLFTNGLPDGRARFAQVSFKIF